MATERQKRKQAVTEYMGWYSAIVDALEAAEINEHGYRDCERFLGCYSPEEPYLLYGEVADVVLPIIEKAVADARGSVPLPEKGETQ